MLKQLKGKLTSASCDVKASTNGTLYCGTDATGAGGGGNRIQIISGRGSASISVDEYYHPTGGVLIAGDTDESQLMYLPYAGTLHNLTFHLDPIQGAGDNCTMFVRSTPVFATSTANTILAAQILDVNQVAQNTKTTVSVTAGTYIKMFMDEAAGTCVGIPSWSFVYEIP